MLIFFEPFAALRLVVFVLLLLLLLLLCCDEKTYGQRPDDKSVNQRFF